MKKIRCKCVQEALSQEFSNTGTLPAFMLQSRFFFGLASDGRLPDDVVDDDGVGGQQEVGEALRNLGELQSRAVENLWKSNKDSHQTVISEPPDSWSKNSRVL